MAKRGLAASVALVLVATTASSAAQTPHRWAWDWTVPGGWTRAPVVLEFHEGLSGSLSNWRFSAMSTGGSPNEPLAADGDGAFHYKITGFSRTGRIRVDGHRYTASGTFVVLTVAAENDRPDVASPAGWDRRHWGHFALFDTAGGRYFSHPWLRTSRRGGHGVGARRSVTYQVPFDVPETAIPAHATIRAESGDETAWLRIPRP